MKSIIIYFSQTGNTRKIARSIHSGMKELVEQCDIARIQDVKREDLTRYDLIGLGGPVWHRREPVNVLNFIEYGYGIPVTPHDDRIEADDLIVDPVCRAGCEYEPERGCKEQVKQEQHKEEFNIGSLRYDHVVEDQCKENDCNT